MAKVSDIGLGPMRQVAEAARAHALAGYGWPTDEQSAFEQTFSPEMVLALLDHIDKIEGERNGFWAQAQAGWGRAKEEIAENKRLIRRLAKRTEKQT